MRWDGDGAVADTECVLLGLYVLIASIVVVIGRASAEYPSIELLRCFLVHRGEVDGQRCAIVGVFVYDSVNESLAFLVTCEHSVEHWCLLILVGEV